MKTTLQLLETAPASWPTLAELAPEVSTWQEIEAELDSLAVKAATLAAYLGTRTGTDGTGRKEHADAIKAANRRRTKIRRAIGYSYPDRGALVF